MEDWKAQYIHWRSDAFDGPTRAELAAVTDPDELEDRFRCDLSFGTGGLRALMGAGTNRMNRYTVRRASRGLGDWLIRRGLAEKGVAIAYDSRLCSQDFAMEAACTLCASGIRVGLFARPTPTPVLSYAVRRYGWGGGAVVTASHNPKEYNGYKVYDESGCQLVPHQAAELTAYIGACADPAAIPVLTPQQAEASGLLRQLDDSILADFEREVLSLSSPGMDPKGFSLVYSPLHGAGGEAVCGVLTAAGYDVTVVPQQAEPDGSFPTVVSPNPEEPTAMAMAIALAEQTGAPLALATDPDCDRLGAAVRKGNQYIPLTGNQLGALLLEHLIRRRPDRDLSRAVLVKTVVTGELGAAIARKHGMPVLETPTGFKFIGERIKALEADPASTFFFGFEESYGYLAATYALDKDGVGAALLTAEMAAACYARGETPLDALERLHGEFGYYLDALDSVTLTGRQGAAAIAGTMNLLRRIGTAWAAEVCSMTDYLDGCGGMGPFDMLKYHLSNGSWLAVRPSGTEPKLKVYYSIRGQDRQEAQQILGALRARLSGVLPKTTSGGIV